MEPGETGEGEQEMMGRGPRGLAGGAWAGGEDWIAVCLAAENLGSRRDALVESLGPASVSLAALGISLCDALGTLAAPRQPSLLKLGESLPFKVLCRVEQSRYGGCSSVL